MTKAENILLELIRMVVTDRPAALPKDITGENWQEVMALACRQGVLGIIFDAMTTLPQEDTPDRNIILKLISKIAAMEAIYQKHKMAIKDLAQFYSEEGIRIMLMKGYGLSLNWPQPDHRPVGDIDCYNFGAHELADHVVHDKLGITIDNSHHKHSVFHFKGATVENHYDFLNIYGHKSTAEIEQILKGLVIFEETTSDVDTNTFKLRKCDIPNVWLPSIRFNLLYLLRHSGEHFASVDMTLRVVLDWAFYIKANAPVDWEWLLETINKVGMKSYLAVLNAICIRFLGFDKELFPNLPVDDRMLERTIGDILHPEVEQAYYHNTIREIVFRFSRWWRNRWKHDMVFRESRYQSLKTQLWSHILKPTL